MKSNNLWTVDEEEEGKEMNSQTFSCISERLKLFETRISKWSVKFDKRCLLEEKLNQ